MFLGGSFSFDEKTSDMMYGLQIVHVDSSSLLEQNFGVSRKTVTEKVKGKDKIYSYGVENNVLTFELEFFKEGIWTYEERVNITKWFFVDKYCDLEVEDFPLIFKCKATKGNFYNNYNNQGYVKIEFECNSPYAYSPIQVAIFDLSNNTTTQIITIENKSNVLEIYKPELQIEMKGSTSVKLENLTNSGKIFEITELNNNEVIYVNNETEKVYSVLSQTRFNNITNKRFFELVYGKNQIKITGKCKIIVRQQFPMMI